MPEVTAEAIPEELKERDQWLLWDASAGAPRRPHWRGNFSVSWSDPDDWHSFEEALEAARDRESWGIGYVFARGNDNYARGLYGALDLDGCVADGSPKDWLPSLQPFFDAGAYMEYSPSGEGIHIPIVGLELPDWWKNVHFSEDEHEGVEAYEAKFFTFTGDTLQGCGDSVVEHDELVEDWLLDAYTAIRDEVPPAMQPDEQSQREPEKSREEIEQIDRTVNTEDVFDAIDHLRPSDLPLSSTYTEDENGDWESWDPGYRTSESGKSLKRHKASGLFKDFAESNPSDATWFGPLDIFAAEEGIIRDPWDDLAGDDWWEAVDRARERGAPIPEYNRDPVAPDEAPTTDEGATEAENPDEQPDPSPEQSTTDESDADTETRVETGISPTDPAGGLTHNDGRYGYLKEREDEQGNTYMEFIEVTNFTLETVSYIETYEGTLITIRVHPHSDIEPAYEVQVHPTVFNDASSFKEEIVRGRTTRYDPQGRHNKALNDLRMTGGGQDAPEFIGTEYIGLHGEGYDEWVSPAGTLTADGWSDDPRFKYYEKGGNMETESSIEEKWQLSPQDDTDYDRDEVRQICERVPKTRKPDRGLPILGWFYAAPLKPVVHDIEGEFNLCQVTGDTEAGKTSTLQMFYQLFGADPAPFGCGDTGFTIEKKLASSCGLPIWLDEYKPTDLAEGKLKWLHRRLREVTREKSVSKGRADLGEVTFKMRAPVIFSGEQTVTEAAVRRRTIMTHLTDQATEGEHQRAFCELTGASYTGDDGEERYPSGLNLADHALAYYQYILAQDTDTLRERWQTARSKARDHLQSIDASSIDGTEFQGIQTVVFGIGVFRAFAIEHGVEKSALPTEEDVRAAIEHVVSNIGPDGRRREHIDEFTELLAQAASAGYLGENVHHRVMQSQKWDGDVLAFHMPTTFSAVKKYVREYNLEGDYSLLGKNDYIDSYRDKAEESASYPLAVNHRVRNIENGAKAVVIDPDRAAAVLPDGFNLNAFLKGAENAVADHDGPETPLTALEAGDMETVTGELVQLYQNNKDWYEMEGWLVDETGATKLIVRDEFDYEFEEGGVYRFTRANITSDGDMVAIEPVPNITQVEAIEPGDGTTHPDGIDWPASGSDEEGSESQPATADGGERSPSGATAEDASEADAEPQDGATIRQKSKRLVDSLEGESIPEMKILEAAKSQFDWDMKTAKTVLKKAADEYGHLEDLGNGEYRPLV